LQKEEEVPKPIATFQFEVSDDNGLEVTFTNFSKHATSYEWDFGDEIGTSTEENVTYTYADGGTYSVSLTATNKSGSAVHTKDVTVVSPTAENLIKNGGFDNTSEWTIINLYECTNQFGLVTIADGIATWTETEAGPWKHMGIYQELVLEAGTYNVDLWVEYSGIDQIWGEVFVGQTQPTPCTDQTGTDYSDNRVLVAFNAWDCNQAYTGYAAANACNVPDEGVNGQFTIDVAGTYYFVFKAGGSTYGTNGIKVDNITLFKQ
jgi:PKD repeat protein